MSDQPTFADISAEAPVLIVGAGPTGLTAALELARRQVPVRIIERREGPSPLSRAVGIMPWAMDILDQSGAGALVRAAAQPVQGVEVWQNTKRAFELHLDVDPDPNVRLFCLPQNETEAILAKQLAEHGVKVEFEHNLEAIDQSAKLQQATINGSTQTYSFILGADGSRSTVRQHLGFEMKGYDLPEKWSIADVEASGWTAPGTFRVFLKDDGRAVFVIPMAKTRYRIVASQPDALAAMPVPINVTKIHRAGDFTISIRQAQSYGTARIWLAGDAAHTHSPVGGRGMNLGIEDASEWVERLVSNQLYGYSASRHTRGKQIIDFTETARRNIMTNNRLKKKLALLLVRLIIKFKPLNQKLVRRMLLT